MDLSSRVWGTQIRDLELQAPQGGMGFHPSHLGPFVAARSLFLLADDVPTRLGVPRAPGDSHPFGVQARAPGRHAYPLQHSLPILPLTWDHIPHDTSQMGRDAERAHDDSSRHAACVPRVCKSTLHDG